MKKFSGLKDKILYIKTNNVRKLLAEVSFKINNLKPKNLVSVTGTNENRVLQIFIFKYSN